MAATPFLMSDLQQVVARWLRDDRCKPTPLEISVKFYTDLDTYIDLPTAESLLEANKHHIKTQNVRRTNPTRTSKALR